MPNYRPTELRRLFRNNRFHCAALVVFELHKLLTYSNSKRLENTNTAKLADGWPGRRASKAWEPRVIMVFVFVACCLVRWVSEPRGHYHVPGVTAGQYNNGVRVKLVGFI